MVIYFILIYSRHMEKKTWKLRRGWFFKIKTETINTRTRMFTRNWSSEQPFFFMIIVKSIVQSDFIKQKNISHEGSFGTRFLWSSAGRSYIRVKWTWLSTQYKIGWSYLRNLIILLSTMVLKISILMLHGWDGSGLQIDNFS